MFKRTRAVKKTGQSAVNRAAGDCRQPSRMMAKSTIHADLTEPMLAELLQLADDLTSRQLRFGVAVAARRQEIEDLKWNDVDLTNGRVWFARPMSLEGGRFVPLPPNILTMLREMKVCTPEATTSSVWAEAGRNRRTSFRTRWRRLFVKWAKAYERGQTFSPPPVVAPPLLMLRRFSMQLMADRGVPADQIAAWAGRLVPTGETRK